MMTNSHLRNCNSQMTLTIVIMIKWQIQFAKKHTSRVAEVAREHGWHPPKSLDLDENFKPEHTLFCRELRFVTIYAHC